MGLTRRLRDWPVYRQLAERDLTGRGAAAKSRISLELTPRTSRADQVVKSVCPYCAVGVRPAHLRRAGQGHADRGGPGFPRQSRPSVSQRVRSLQLTTGSARQHQVLYRRPYGTDRETLELDTAMDMIAERTIVAREKGWQWEADGARTRRTMGIASLRGATLDTARAAIEARVLVTDRLTPLKVQGRTLHQVGLRYQWGTNGLSTGDAVNDPISLSLDPNSCIQETKAAACDIRPGRRPRGPARVELVHDYRRRAGITAETGREM